MELMGRAIMVANVGVITMVHYFVNSLPAGRVKSSQEEPAAVSRK
jgi:hypothetical protein